MQCRLWKRAWAVAKGLMPIQRALGALALAFRAILVLVDYLAPLAFRLFILVLLDS